MKIGKSKKDFKDVFTLLEKSAASGTPWLESSDWPILMPNRKGQESHQIDPITNITNCITGTLQPAILNLYRSGRFYSPSLIQKMKWSCYNLAISCYFYGLGWSG